MRRLHSAPRPGADYPSLRALAEGDARSSLTLDGRATRRAWLLVAPLALAPLAAPTVAHADATIPQRDKPREQPRPPQQPTPPSHYPHRLGGKPISPRLPEKLGDAGRSVRGLATLLLHPHAPDEPCLPAALEDEA
jgi:hypothetical protein